MATRARRRGHPTDADARKVTVMDAWWKTEAGDYLNPIRIGALTTSGSGSTWSLNAFFPGDESPYVLAGTWTTEADAEQAAQQLVQGFDPSTLNA